VLIIVATILCGCVGTPSVDAARGRAKPYATFRVQPSRTATVLDEWITTTRNTQLANGILRMTAHTSNEMTWEWYLPWHSGKAASAVLVASLDQVNDRTVAVEIRVTQNGLLAPEGVYDQLVQYLRDNAIVPQ
jgi:hypothetical protein